jgi:hypothetical protein
VSNVGSDCTIRICSALRDFVRSFLEIGLANEEMAGRDSYVQNICRSNDARIPPIGGLRIRWVSRCPDADSVDFVLRDNVLPLKCRRPIEIACFDTIHEFVSNSYS